jgi:hypothetical protein
MIDLSSTCGSIVVSICNLFLKFIIYFWIKIKLKVLILPKIQKPYFRHLNFMAGFVDILRPTHFHCCALQEMAIEGHIVANCHVCVLGIQWQDLGLTHY